MAVLSGKYVITGITMKHGFKKYVGRCTLMKKKNIIITIALILIVIIAVALSVKTTEKKTFEDLEAASIESATVHLIPPDITVEIEDIDMLAELLQDVVIYNIDFSYILSVGQGVTYTVAFKDGTETKVMAYNPFIIIDGIGYKCKYEPCETLNAYANDLLSRTDTSKNQNDNILDSDEFWENVTELIFYDFDENIYKTSDNEKLEMVQQIFTEMRYEEIENPWIEGWYHFEIQRGETVHSLGITSDIISFDGKFYKVTDSVGKEISSLLRNN